MRFQPAAPPLVRKLASSEGDGSPPADFPWFLTAGLKGMSGVPPIPPPAQRPAKGLAQKQ